MTFKENGDTTISQLQQVSQDLCEHISTEHCVNLKGPFIATLTVLRRGSFPGYQLEAILACGNMNLTETTSPLLAKNSTPTTLRTVLGPTIPKRKTKKIRTGK